VPAAELAAVGSTSQEKFLSRALRVPTLLSSIDLQWDNGRVARSGMLSAPGGAEVLTGRLVRGPFAAGGAVAGGGAFGGTGLHLFFREDEGGRCDTFVAAVEQAAAKKRQVLDVDAVVADQRKIGTHGTFCGTRSSPMRSKAKIRKPLS